MSASQAPFTHPRAEEGHSPESTSRIEESSVVENHPPCTFAQCFFCVYVLDALQLARLNRTGRRR